MTMFAAHETNPSPSRINTTPTTPTTLTPIPTTSPSHNPTTPALLGLLYSTIRLSMPIFIAITTITLETTPILSPTATTSPYRTTTPTITTLPTITTIPPTTTTLTFLSLNHTYPTGPILILPRLPCGLVFSGVCT